MHIINVNTYDFSQGVRGISVYLTKYINGGIEVIEKCYEVWYLYM